MLTKFMDAIEDGNFRVRVVLDDDYETRGSYSYDTEKETREAEEEELRMLRSGTYVALGFILEKRCHECGTWINRDSLWGVVIKNSEAKVRECLVETGFLSKEGRVQDDAES